MLPLLVQTLIFASSGLLSIGSITLVILLLISDRGWRNGLAYALGYTGAYCVIGISAVSIGYRNIENIGNKPPLGVSILLILLGLLLFSIAFRNNRKPSVENSDPPRFFSFVDRLSPLKSLGFGSVVSLMNFKNLALYLTALSGVILSDLMLQQKIIIALAAAMVFCLSVIIPVSIYLMFPKRAGILLNKLKNAIQNHSHAIGIWAPIIFGLIFIIRGTIQIL